MLGRVRSGRPLLGPDLLRKIVEHLFKVLGSVFPINLLALFRMHGVNSFAELRVCELDFVVRTAKGMQSLLQLYVLAFAGFHSKLKINNFLKY
jgi:hypothetical protein